MAIEASFATTDGEFPLAAVFSELPDAQIELDRVVPTDKAVVPYFWVRDSDVAESELGEIEHPGVHDLRVIDDVAGEALIRIDWDFDYESVLTAILETNVILVSAIGKQDKWTFEIRGDEQQAVSNFQSYCRSNEIPIKLTQLHALAPLRSGQEYDLTEAQREALTLAYARGYYDSPREVAQTMVADELGITRQALASRLQRGTRRLIGSTLVSPAK
ncbi:bacterio-opsin activator domain-containing protein [Saliphagus sp. GCM10025308]